MESSDFAHLKGCYLSIIYIKTCLLFKVPENCQVSSKYFTIKKIAQFSPVVAQETSALMALNKIYKIDDNRIVMESKNQGHELVSLDIPDRTLIEQIKEHRDRLGKLLKSNKD